MFRQERFLESQKVALNFSILSALWRPSCSTPVHLPDSKGHNSTGSKKKTEEKQTHKQNFHGIVPGVSGGLVYVSFSSHKE